MSRPVPEYDFSTIPESLEIPLIVAPYRFVEPGFHRHTHTYGEIVCIMDGHGVHQREHARCAIRRGDVLYIPPGVMHGFHDSSGMDIRNVAFDRTSIPEGVWRSLGGLSGYHTLFHLEPSRSSGCDEGDRLALTEQELPAVQAILDRMAWEHRAVAPGNGAMLTALLIELITVLCRFLSRNEIASRTSISRAAALMEQAWNSPLRLADLAAEAHLSENQFLRLFRASYGVSPMQRLREIRLDHAARLIMETDAPISDVATHCGFPDPNYFTRAFRQRFGRPPRGFRRSQGRSETGFRKTARDDAEIPPARLWNRSDVTVPRRTP